MPSKGASAYYPPGAYTYLKSFDVPVEWAEKLIFLELQGVYRHAMVFVNEEFAGNRANGYARFVLDLTPYIKAGRPNQLRIEVRSGQDSRWYSGAGLHRTGRAARRPIRCGFRSTVSRSPRSARSPSLAVVEVATKIANAGPHTHAVTLTTADPRPGRHRSRS